MKKNFVFMFVLSLSFGCGTDTPFKRGAPSDSGGSGQGVAADGLSAEYFQTRLAPLLSSSCAGCHDNPAPTLEAASDLVVPGNPDSSLLLMKASGQGGHEEVWSASSEEYVTLRAWILGEE